MTDDNREFKLPQVDDTNAHTLLFNSCIQAMELLNLLEQFKELNPTINGKPIVINTLKLFLKESVVKLERYIKQFDGYWEDKKTFDAISDILQNQRELNNLMAFLSPNARTVVSILAHLYMTDIAKFNTLTTNIIKTPLKILE